ncbi:hypothetical protein HUJ04_007440 [Dendroctonus ponderosae]|uniref:LanC-like protein 3 homolog n=2 Tax=Dendroctonus ponderosae TaxID=77166 RepID=A0AAR5PLX1_DENPD|nr:hypothetical protein HUJ04_007440 [Dendroctonus ponderosae]
MSSNLKIITNILHFVNKNILRFKFGRKFSQYLKKDTMGDRLRYFPNPKPVFSPKFGVASIPQEQIRDSLNEMVLRISKEFPATDRNAADGIYLGTAGIGYMFYHVSKHSTFSFNKDIYLQKALQYIQPALKAAQSTKSLKDFPSFILGPAGVYAVAAVLYNSIGDANQSQYFRELYYESSKYCSEPNFLNCGSDELFVGRAGYIMGALWLAKETNTPLRKSDLYSLCKIILASGRKYALSTRSPCPLMYSYYQVEYLGAAHGISSILQSILSVPGYLDENPSDANDIKISIDYLLSIQTPEGNFPAATDDIGHESKLVHWCHGAGGVFYLMAKSYLVFQEEKYLQSCRRMADLIWHKGLLKKGPGICHGVAGNGYVFLIMYRLTSEPQYLYQAICFYQFMESDAFKSNARTPDCPFSLYEGVAGTVCFLADLTDPLSAAFPFSDIF